MKRYETEITLGNTRLKFVTDENYSKPSVSSSHAHPNYEFFYVGQGELEIHTENDIYTVSKGKLAIIPPALYHRTLSGPDTKKSSVYFSFIKKSGKGLEDIYPQFSKMFSGAVLRVLDSAEDLGILVTSLCSAMELECFCKEERSKALATTLILSVYDRLTGSVQEGGAVCDSAVGMRYRYEIDSLLAQNYNSDIDLDFLAGKLFLSSKRVAVLIRSLYGKNFSQVKTEMRIQVAKQLLKETDLTVAAIAEKVGYNSTRGFLSAFSKFTGKTPSEYRTHKKR